LVARDRYRLSPHDANPRYRLHEMLDLARSIYKWSPLPPALVAQRVDTTLADAPHPPGALMAIFSTTAPLTNPGLPLDAIRDY
jgi:hypothetical protein